MLAADGGGAEETWYDVESGAEADTRLGAESEAEEETRLVADGGGTEETRLVVAEAELPVDRVTGSFVLVCVRIVLELCLAWVEVNIGGTEVLTRDTIGSNSGGSGYSFSELFTESRPAGEGEGCPLPSALDTFTLNG